MNEFWKSIEIDPFLIELCKEAFIAMAIGLLLGLEREYSGDQDKGNPRPAGVRTFPIVSLSGYLALYLSDQFSPWIYLATAMGVIGIILVSYLNRTSATPGRSAGTTTEFTILMAFMLGSVVYTEQYELAVALAVVLTALLTLKFRLRAAVERLSYYDIRSILLFIVITVLILPFLPDKNFGPYNVLNPYRIWLIVSVFISLNFGAYFLGKFIKQHRSVWVTGFVGGFVSGTATIWYISRESGRSGEGGMLYSSSIAMAAAVMFPKIMLWIAFFGPALWVKLWYILLVLTGVGVYMALRFWKKARGEKSVERQMGNPVNLRDALVFAALFVLIELLVGWASHEFGNLGIYFASGVSGLLNVDAITLSIAGSSHAGTGLHLASAAVLLAALANTFTKFVFCLLFGSSTLRKASYRIFLPLILLTIGIFVVFVLAGG